MLTRFQHASIHTNSVMINQLRQAIRAKAVQVGHQCGVVLNQCGVLLDTVVHGVDE